MFDIDFKIYFKIRKKFLSYFAVVFSKRRKNVMLVKHYLMCMVKKPSNYSSVGIDLLNFTTDEDIKSFFERFFVENDKNFFEHGIMKLDERW